MGLFDRIRSWFAPNPPPRRPVVNDALLVCIPDDILMDVVIRKTALTGKPVSICRPNPEALEGETADEAKARFERELDAMAELLGVVRERRLKGEA